MMKAEVATTPEKGQPADAKASVVQPINIHDSLNPNGLASNLIASVLFVLLGLVLRAAWWFVRSLWRPDRILGTWNHYFINKRDGKPIFRHDIVVIRRGFLHKMVFYTKANDQVEGEYGGHVVREKDFILLISRAVTDDEAVFQRIGLSPVGGGDTFVGLASAQDYDGHAASHCVILTKQKIDEVKFLEIIARKTVIDRNNRIITLA